MPHGTGGFSERSIEPRHVRLTHTGGSALDSRLERVIELDEVPGTVYAASPPAKDMGVAEMAATLDFKLKLPSYVPDGMTQHNASLDGDSTAADAKLRVAGIYYWKGGLGSLAVEEWRAEKAAAFPPAHTFAQVLDTVPWHKTLSTVTVKVGDVEGHMVSYLLSGMGFNRVYWNENGVNYAVDAYAQLPEPELLKVALSLR